MRQVNLHDRAASFDVIYADPPWSYGFKSPTARSGRRTAGGGVSYQAGVDVYYPTMSVAAVAALPVNNLAARDSVCFMWCTVPMLPEQLPVLAAWGFNYKTALFWHKLRCKGMGYWFRGHVEVLVLGVRGEVKPFRSLLHNLQAFSVRRHSQKPEEFRKIIVDVTPGKRRVELFAREVSVGFAVWGNEVQSDAEVSAVLEGK